MDLQYFTIEHAAEKYVTPVGEIKHLIERGDLSACLYAHKRSFLILEKRDKETVGVGLVSYSGLIRPKPVIITDLLHERKIRLDQPVVVLSPKAIYDWKPDHPFDQKSFPASLRLHRWEPTTCENAKKSNYLFALITPIQSLGMKRLLAKATQKMAEWSPEVKVGSDPDGFPEFEYSWDKRAEFHITDIRIEHSELERVLKGQRANAKKQTSSEVAAAMLAKYNRPHGIRDLIIRVLSTNTGLSAHDIWKKLQRDCERNERVHDIDNVLIEVGSTDLEWINTGSLKSTLTRKSFDATVSKIKKKVLSAENVAG